MGDVPSDDRWRSAARAVKSINQLSNAHACLRSTPAAMNPGPNITPARVMPQVIPKGSKPITPTINETIHKPIPRLAEYESSGGRVRSRLGARATTPRRWRPGSRGCELSRAGGAHLLGGRTEV